MAQTNGSNIELSSKTIINNSVFRYHQGFFIFKKMNQDKMKSHFMMMIRWMSEFLCLVKWLVNFITMYCEYNECGFLFISETIQDTVSVSIRCVNLSYTSRRGILLHLYLITMEQFSLNEWCDRSKRKANLCSMNLFCNRSYATIATLSLFW